MPILGVALFILNKNKSMARKLKNSFSESEIDSSINNYSEDLSLFSTKTKWILVSLATLLIVGGLIIRNLNKDKKVDTKNTTTETESVSDTSNSTDSNKSTPNNETSSPSSSSNNNSTANNNTSNTSNGTTNKQNNTETKTVTQTIYVKNTDNISFAYDSNTVKIKDGNFQCIKDDRILQWNKGKNEWECKKAISVVFGDLDRNSVNVNDSGQLECENNGDILYWDGDDDQWACGAQGSGELLAGSGISSSNNTVSINAPTCSGTEKLQWNGSAFICSTDVDTNTDSQSLSFNSGTGQLTISSGNTVDLSSLSAGVADHNDLNNIQGGTTNEYYHLDSSDYTDLSTFLGFTSLPNTDGTSGQVLKTNGSGALSWQDDTAGTGAVESVFGRTGIVTAQSNDYTWAQINKTTSSIADIVSRSHTDLTDIGTNTHTQIDTHIASTSNPHSVIASQVSADTTNFDNNLSSADATVQKALETLDEVSGGGSTTFLGLTDTLSSYGTGGSILFTSSSAVTEDNLNLFWDDVTDSLGIGTNSLSAKTHVKGGTSDNTAYGLKVDDSSNAKNLYVRNDGQVEFKNFAFPTADGTNGQVLKTNGSGTLSWQDDSGVGTVNYSDVTLDSSRQVGSPTTATTLDKAYDYIWSAGLYSGFGLTDNGDGTINIADGEGVLRTSASPTAPLQLITVSGVNNLSMSQTATNYIYADYNSGSPVISVGTSTSDFNCLDKCILYKVSRVGNEIQYINMMSNNVDANRSYRRKDFEIGQIDIGSGARVAETGNRYFAITAGSFWNVLSNVTTSAFDTSGLDTYDLYYRNGSGGWTRTTGNTQIDNLYYDDGSGTLAPISNNQFATRFIFMSVSETGSHPIVVMGQYNHANQEEAENEAVPGDLPPEVDAVGSILALVTVQKNATNLASILNATEESFATALPTTHNNLAGLQGGTTNEYYHLDLSDYTDLSTFLGFTSLPDTDGTNGQVLTTNGSGSLSFSSLSSLASYAEMYQVENVTATTITTQNVWEEVNNFSQGEVQGVTFSNSDLTVNSIGRYQVNVSLSGTPESANDIFEFAISVNDTIQIKTMQERKFSSTTDAGSISLNGILSLSVNDVIKLELLNQTATGNFIVENANLTLRRID